MRLQGRLEAEAYCRAIRGRLVGALSLYCGDVQVAEDVAQETLARVWDRWATVGRMADPDAWTFRVAFNLTHSWFRRVKARRGREDRYDRDPVRAGLTGLDLSEAVAVREAVAGLPRRQRQALVLRYFQDRTVAEAAAVMGCAEGTVKALTSQAIARLRDDPAVPNVSTVEVPDVT